jgi:hypothetical protein
MAVSFTARLKAVPFLDAVLTQTLSPLPSHIPREYPSAGNSKLFTDATTVERRLSPSSEKTQIWCAIATYALIAIIEKELQLDASLYTCLQILSVSAFEKTQISCAWQQIISPPPCTATLTS